MESELLRERISKMDDVSKMCSLCSYKIMTIHDEVVSLEEVKNTLYELSPILKDTTLFEKMIYPAYKIALITFCQEKNISAT